MKYWLVLSEAGARYSLLSLLDGTRTEVCTRALSHIHTAEDTCYLRAQKKGCTQPCFPFKSGLTCIFLPCEYDINVSFLIYLQRSRPLQHPLTMSPGGGGKQVLKSPWCTGSEAQMWRRVNCRGVFCPRVQQHQRSARETHTVIRPDSINLKSIQFVIKMKNDWDALSLYYCFLPFIITSCRLTCNQLFWWWCKFNLWPHIASQPDDSPSSFDETWEGSL